MSEFEGYDVIANAFGGEYPVCNEDQKARIEAAYKDTLAFEEANGTAKYKCMCDMIIALMQPTVDRKDAIAAASHIAKQLYLEKRDTIRNLIAFKRMLQASEPALDPKKVN